MGFGKSLFYAACMVHDFVSPEQRFKRKVADDSYRRASRPFNMVNNSVGTCFTCNGTGVKTFDNGNTAECRKCGGTGVFKRK